MTGTSMDGIDISLVQSNGIKLERLNKNFFFKYKNKTKKLLLDVLNQDISLDIKRKKYLDKVITNEHYSALQNLEIIQFCELIGFHGQTIYHNPVNKTSIQLGDPSELSRITGKDVVFDFRKKDLEMSGQGAPLAPIYHKFIIEESNLELPTCFLNIGGVSNLTYWDGIQLIGFDTGPGNALMDDYMRTIFNKQFDKNGLIASKGKPNTALVKEFISQDFFKKSPPKSLDRNSFIHFYNLLLKKNISSYDVMATLLEFTIESINIGIKSLQKKIKNIVITGGGCRNNYLMQELTNRLSINAVSEKNLNLDFDYIESELIAYLSARSLYKLPFTFPSTTGVSKPLSGGKLYECL